MCSRGELKQLLYELLFRVDQVAYLGARTQFTEECNNLNSQRFAEYNEKHSIGSGNERFGNILRFQKAYIRYYVFACDPYTEFIVPLTSSSLALFITNILSRDGPSQSPNAYHTSRSIIEFLQITQNHVVERLLVHYKSDLLKVIKELRLPYNIEYLTQKRKECYHQHFSDPNSLQNNQVRQIALEAQSIFFNQHIPKSSHSTIKQEEFIFQVPVQGANISVMQPGIPDQMINYTPIVHTVPASNDGYMCDVDSTTPLLILTPVTPMNTTQMMPNEMPAQAPVIKIPLQSDGLNVKENGLKFSFDE